MQAESLADYISPALIFDDQTKVEESLDTLVSTPNVLMAQVRHFENQKIYAEYNKTASAAPTPLADVLRWVEPIRIRASIKDRDEVIGALILQVDQSSIVIETAKISAVVAVLSLLAILAVIAGLIGVQRSITQPLEALGALMDEVSTSGDYKPRAPNSPLVEIKQLSAGFNNLLEQIAFREKRIVRMANFDSLTGLRNRRGFIQQIEREIGFVTAERPCLALLFVDLDGFKAVNDSLGHDIGDQVLIDISQRIMSVIRVNDQVLRLWDEEQRPTVARLGGDEFTLLLPHLRVPSDGLVVANRICEALREPIVLPEHSLRITASIGVSMYPNDGDNASDLLKHADSAMYYAKSLGKDQVRFYNQAMTESARRRLWLSNSLREAVESGSLHLEYQPIVGTQSGQVEKLEALLRWEMEDGETISPTEFIPIAEASGLIEPIGHWVLNRACQELAMINAQRSEPLLLAVNVSPAQLKESSFAGSVDIALKHAGIAGHLLELEVTEEVLIHGVSTVTAQFHELAELGVQITLDDFGTGYSSLKYIKALPIQGLKIDRSFIHDLPKNFDSLTIVKTIMAMAKALNLEITAEGIETASQQRLLTELGCEQLQGFLFSPSIRAERVADYCRDHSNHLAPRAVKQAT